MKTYPVRLRARRELPLSRWLWLVKWLPRGIHTFNTGVLRWAWRVDYYGYEVLGTDRYPPFTLAEVPEYPAGLQIGYPDRLPCWRPLVAWLLAIPHVLVVGAFAGVATWTVRSSVDNEVVAEFPAGLMPVLILIAVVALLFTGRYPQGVYDLLLGINRWMIRTGAYVALLTDVYPPFRLDQGDAEPGEGRDYE
ncbi:DUF4389 domain-containing protein [Longispora albida]|uniref:DUF4389 domain-containing protein n=1 Tax=Longispora albida TaxID=203523 RepID=UPI00036AD280|nr:DUF4389 domain-containing protein [Longispora albida]